MIVEQFYTNCLAHDAYYIESEGNSAIIDPLRDVQFYMDYANSRRTKIKYVFETHFHADFVSGHLTLAEKTGAEIIYGPGAKPNFKAVVAKNNQMFSLGNASIQVLHTPGHTLESSTFLLNDENGRPYAIFTGDTLFLGDVGRPDLAQNDAYSKELLAGLLYDSLRNVIMPLPDDVLVYPGHGEGSACGKTLGSDPFDTLGHQKLVNYALRSDMLKDEFVQEVLNGLLPPPSYFPKNAEINRNGYPHLSNLIEKSNIALTPDEFEKKISVENTLVLDVRASKEFVKGFIPGSLFIGIDGNLAQWAGALIKDLNTRILLVVDENRAIEAISRLSRVGFDSVVGYLAGGLEDWIKMGKPVDSITCITPYDLENRYSQNMKITDVRNYFDYDLSHINGAVHAPLEYFDQFSGQFSHSDTFYVYCGNGYRSTIASSMLKRKGYQRFVNILGSYEAVKLTEIPIVGLKD